MPTLATAFFLSGFSALLYQVAWQRLLGLFAGSDAHSATIVVSAYLAGLGVGSLLGSVVADRLSSRRAVRVFGLCNLGIALFACLSPSLYYDLLFLRLHALAASPLWTALVSFVSLLVPTTLMGLSLPLLARAVVRSMAEAPWRISLLYAINTLGSAAGSLIAGWYLMGTLGYARAVYLGGALSALVALLAFAGARRFGATDPLGAARAPDGAGLDPRGVPSSVWAWCALVCLAGFVAISLELVWFRVIYVVVGATSYTFAHLLAFVLVGYAAGTWLGGYFLHRVPDPRRAFFGLQAGIALCAVGTVFLLYANFERIIPFLVGRCPEGLGPVVLRRGCRMSAANFANVYLVLPALMLLPANVLIGASFPVVQKVVQTSAAAIGQRVGLIQFAGIVGNVAGGLLTGTLLFGTIGAAGALAVIAALGLVFVGLLVVESARSRGRRAPDLAVGVAAGVALAALLLVFPDTKAFWAALHRGTPTNSFVAEAGSGVAVIHVAEDGGYVFANGGWQGRVPYEDYHAFLGVLPALVHQNPRQVLVIGVGSGGTSFGVGVNPTIERITAVEIVGSELPVLREFALSPRGAPARPLLTDPRYRLVVGDGRHELAIAPGRFDIIEADALLPVRSHSGMLFSVEFFRQASAKLADGGLMAQWSPTRRTLASFMSVFPHGVNIGGRFLLGSRTPIDFDKTRTLERMNSSAVRSYLSRAGLSVEGVSELLEKAEITRWSPATPRTGDVNTDLWPKDEYFLNNRW